MKNCLRKTLLPLFILSFLKPDSSQAQIQDCEPNMPFTVNAPSGMRIRSAPSLKGKLVGHVPNNEMVKACVETFDFMTIEGIDGNWRFIHYKDLKGYMWDGYLEKYELQAQIEVVEVLENQKVDSIKKTIATESLEVVEDKKLVENIEEITPIEVKETKKEISGRINILTETFNYCDNIANINPGKMWYAVYEDKNQYLFKPVELMVIKSKYSLAGKMEFDIKTAQGEGSIFLFSLDKPVFDFPNITSNSDFFNQNPRQLMPGMRVSLYPNSPDIASLGTVFLSALGNVESVGDCPTISNYKLIARTVSETAIEQNLLEDLSTLGTCGIPDIYWFGDLNQDGYTDLILVAVNEKSSTFTLFVTDMSRNDKFLVKNSEWTVKDCK